MARCAELLLQTWQLSAVARELRPGSENVGLRDLSRVELALHEVEVPFMVANHVLEGGDLEAGRGAGGSAWATGAGSGRGVKQAAA